MTPGAVSNTPTCAQKKPHTHQNMFMHRISHHRRSAGRSWCWHSSRLLKHQQQHTVLVWPGMTLGSSVYSWPPLRQIVPQSPFGLSARSSAWYFCFVSQKCLLVCLCNQHPDSAVLFLFTSHPPNWQNDFCQQLIRAFAWKAIHRGLPADIHLSALCCLKSGFSGVQAEMLVNMIDYPVRSLK